MLRRGIQQSTVAEIADVAALGKGTVYLHFESKDQLVDGLRQRYIDSILDTVRDAVGRAGTSETKVAAFVQSFIEASTRHPELHHLLFEEAGGDEASAFLPVRDLFVEVAGPAEALLVDFVLGGIHAAAITIAHRPPNRRAAEARRLARLVTQWLTIST
jgi:AcrR family transcriptional regulator